MANLDQIEQALRAADAAGNKEDAARLAKAYAEARGQPPQQAQASGDVSPVVDAIRSVPGGVAKGGAGLAGLPGDLNELINGGIQRAGNFISPGAGDDVRKVLDVLSPAPKSSTINDAISSPFGGYYKPQTKAGEYAETIASFAPAAIAPGSIGQRVARVLVPGAASETAGQATKGTKLEPYARAAGALAGGMLEGAGEGMLGNRANPAPSLEQIGKLKADTYKAAEQAGVVINNKSFNDFATNLASDVTKNNVVSAKLHPQTLAALEAIQSEAALGQPISLERADIVRQEVLGAFDSASSRDARLLSKIKNSLDAYLDNLTPADTISGDPATAVPLLKQARNLAQREFKAKEIQKLIDLAENSSGSNYAASGPAQALRVQFKNLNAKLIKDPMLAKTFSAAEREAIEKVVQGGPIENAMRLVGKLAPTNNISMGVGPSLGAAGGSFVGGPVGAAVGAAAVPAVGAASRLGANALTSRNAQLAAELMRRGAPVANATNIKQGLLVDLLLSQQGAHR